MLFPDGVTVTIVYRTITGTDDFGNDVYGETTSDVGPCSVQPASSRENLNYGDQLTRGVVVFAPYGTPVDYIDAVIVGGQKYEVTGQPDVWVSPFSGHTAPVRIDGTLVEGSV